MNHEQADMLPLTRKLIDAIDDFRRLLEAEAHILASASAAELENFAREKLDRAERLEAIDRECRARLADMGYPDINRESLGRALQSHPDATALAENWRQAIAGLQDCLRLNTQAGAIIHLQAQRTRRAVEILSGSAAQAVTYGPDGREGGATVHHRLGKA